VKVIHTSEIATLLAGCSEVLRAELERVQEYWTPDAPPPTVALGALGTALIETLTSVTDDELCRIASTVEQVLVEGSENAKNAVATGFLEAVLSASDDEPTATRFLRKLGHHSQEYCKAWNQFCGIRTPGVGDHE
jgi:hypothetical protein